MLNSRSGHGFEGLLMIPVVLVCMLIGWPVVIPMAYLADAFSGNPATKDMWFILLGASTVLGAWFHYKFWVIVSGWVNDGYDWLVSKLFS